jgi:N utilization substance protein B
MGARRKSREAALQLLYQAEFEEPTSKASLARFWASRKEDRLVREYADELVLGILEHRDELDKMIQAVSKNWRVARMSIVDRNILRLASYEMRYGPGLAPAVVINEAIEIAKRYSGPEASVFVNGILDGIRKNVEHAAAEAASSPVARKGKGNDKGTGPQAPRLSGRGGRRKRPE